MASDQPIRVAIIGLGFGAEFIPIYQNYPGVEMYAICRRSKKGLEECGQRFGSIPDHQWQVRVLCIFAVLAESGDNFPSLLGRKALQGRGQIKPDDGGFVFAGEANEFFQSTRRNVLVFASELNRPGANELVDMPQTETVFHVVWTQTTCDL